MTERDDHQLLAEFARENSETAFAALVGRHINLVYATALRSVGNTHAAEEIAQAVFIILAQKAGKLSARVVVSGWLYQTTRLTAANYLRGEIRRQQREQEAYMQSILNEPDTTDAWRQIAPLLDGALEKLGDQDRNAVVLRFLENKSLMEVGMALGASEDAAKMRVNRALEKLRKIFGKRGVTLTAAIIAGAVSANSAQATPLGLAATVTAAAAKGAAISASLTTLVKITMETMTWLKFKFAAGVGVAVLLAGGAATVAVLQTGGSELTPEKIIEKSQATYAALSSYSDNGKIIAEVGNQTIPTTFNIRLQQPNLYRVEWTQTTAFFTNGGTVWSAGNGDFMAMKHGNYNAQPAKYRDMQSALAAATGISGSASSTIPGTFFNQNQGNVLKINPAKSTLQKLKDEPVDGVDCYVLSTIIDAANLPNGGKLEDNTGKIGKRTTMLWIGKRDHLIHQAQNIVEGASITLPRLSDATIKAMVEGQKKPATPENLAAMRAQLEAVNKQFQSSVASGKIVSTQTHENIVVNRKFSATDFAR